MFALQGIVEYKETSPFIVNKHIVRKAIENSKELNKNGFGCFYDSYLALLKMLGQSEYDKYRDEIVSGVLFDITKFGTDSDTQDDIINNVVQQLGIDFNKVKELKVENKAKQVFSSRKNK